ncbi:MAG: hypothetical protein P8176_05515 [Gammaproteobacteria bacterium]
MCFTKNNNTMMCLLLFILLPLTACSKNDSGLPLLGKSDLAGQTIWVQKADGSIQCAPPIDKAASLDAQQRELVLAGVDVLSSDCGAKATDMACGLPTGGINFFRINVVNSTTANDLGFETVVFDEAAFVLAARGVQGSAIDPDVNTYSSSGCNVNAYP